MIEQRFFVLGCDRSGTSLLRRVLNAHSMIACPAETKFIMQLLNVIEVEPSYLGLTAMGFSRREVLQRLRDFIDSFLTEYAEREGKVIWVEKTTHSLFYADKLDDIFESQLRYIGIVRHGLDVAYSLENVTHSPFTVIEQFAEQDDDRAAKAARFWASQNGRLIDYQQRFGERLKVFRYEELTAQPLEAYQAVFDFIGVPFEENAVRRFNEFEHTGGYEDPQAVASQTIAPNFGRYRNWPLEKQERLFAIMRDELEYFGYSLGGC